MFPIALKLTGRPCLVVGGGGVALRKVLSLLEAGARVTVVAPDAVAEIRTLAAAGRLRLERRPYEAGEDVGGYVLIFAATDTREVNRAVFEDGSRAGASVNVADDPELCTFHLPARVRRGPLEISIASGGGAPFLVRRLRQAFEARMGPEWAEWVESAASFRGQVRARTSSAAEQEACFDRFVAATLNRERLTVRIPGAEELSRWLETPEAPMAVPSAERSRAAAARGFVSLVGAGPGCAALLTVRGRERLATADAIVYDRLAAGALPTDLPATVELRGVGKEAGHHPVAQEQINELLVELAGQGKRVVRLKGGDPYVFGRGGEEAEALEAAGIPFEIIPGVTAALAATAFAGIPVTHRREAVQLTLLTAHECMKTSGPQVRWDLLAQQGNATLVGYMGVTALPQVVSSLLAGGMDPRTPAAMVEQGATSAQRSVIATLETLPAEVVRLGLVAPAIFVIGPTVSHADRLNWAATRPLAGQRLAVPADAVSLCAALDLRGAEIVPLPFPPTPAARVVRAARPLTGCIVRSPAEVEAFDEQGATACPDDRWTAWCMNARTAERARERGWRFVELLDGASEAELIARLERRPGAGRPTS
jgi:uroporphyrin-III C-methyltransferase/precorrin-2 dehydrogenase/sirohydrochlorin ferrochelatase